jgi:two-component system, OmpR family, response regulator RegX3
VPGSRVALRVLYLEEEPFEASLPQHWLVEEGHVVHAFARGREAIKAIERESFDLAILDAMVPDRSAEEVLRWIRQRRPEMRVLFATSHEDEHQIVRTLEMGADDYVVKPLRRAEFLARVSVAGRLMPRPARAVQALDLPPYRIDAEGHAIYLEGREVRLTPRLMSLAALLFRKRGALVSRAEIYELVWGIREALNTRSVDTHVSRLRTLLELDGRHGWKLTSIYQHGYRLEHRPGMQAGGRAA